MHAVTNEQVKRAFCSILTRTVTVEAERDTVTVASEYLHVSFREGGATRCNSMHGSCAVTSKDIEISFNEQNTVSFANSVSGTANAKQYFALVEEDALARIDVLGIICSKRSTPKPNQVSLLIFDREHQSIAESVVHTLIVEIALHAHPGGENFFATEPHFQEVLVCCRERVRSDANPE
jgi:hypothetical protein